MSIANRVFTRTPRILASTRLSAIHSQLKSPTLTRTMASSHSLPKTMKGILIEKTGGTEVLQYKTDLPVPIPKEGEILVKNDYIGINYIDTYAPFQLPTPSNDLPSANLNNTATSERASTHHPNPRSSAAKPKAPSFRLAPATSTP